MPTPRASMTILWRRLDAPGHEAMWLSREGDVRRLSGTAIFADKGRPCLLSYVLTCNASSETRSLELTGRIGLDDVSVSIITAGDGRWLLNGAEAPAVAGCIDLDLAFSAATNMLPIRRLNLGVGEKASVTSAWLTFPALRLEALPQVYQRRDEWHYDYGAPTLGFSTRLTVNADGIVTDYPPLWSAESRFPFSG